MRPEPGPESLRKRASFSKVPPRCPANRRVFPGHRRESATRKSRRIPAAYLAFQSDWEAARSEPLGAAPVAVAVPIAAHHAVLKAVVPPAAAEAAIHMRQDGKAALLAV